MISILLCDSSLEKMTELHCEGGRKWTLKLLFKISNRVFLPVLNPIIVIYSTTLIFGGNQSRDAIVSLLSGRLSARSDRFRSKFSLVPVKTVESFCLRPYV